MIQAYAGMPVFPQPAVQHPTAPASQPEGLQPQRHSSSAGGEDAFNFHC